MFNITEHVDFDRNGRAICPSCALEGKGNKKNLALIPNTNGAYKCHRGCTPQQIREALGNPKSQVTPTALVQTTVAPRSTTVSPQKVREACEKLMQSSGPAKSWLHQRGISDDMITRYSLGLVRAKSGEVHRYAISIPFPMPTAPHTTRKNGLLLGSQKLNSQRVISPGLRQESPHGFGLHGNLLRQRKLISVKGNGMRSCLVGTCDRRTYPLQWQPSPLARATFPHKIN